MGGGGGVGLSAEFHLIVNNGRSLKGKEEKQFSHGMCLCLTAKLVFTATNERKLFLDTLS